MVLRRLMLIFWRAGSLWMRHDCVDLSAAFAYHSLQSILPALLIALSVASRILGRDPGLQDSLLTFAARWLTAASAQALQNVVQLFLRQGFGAGIFGVVALLLTATNAYLTLQRGSDRIWWLRPYGLPRLRGWAFVRRYLRLRLKAISLVALVGLFIGLDQMISSRRLLGSIDLRTTLLQSLPTGMGWQRQVNLGADLLASLLITFAAGLLFFWLLPSRRVQLRLLLPGAALCSLALTLLNLLLGRALLLLGIRFQAYGVVGGVLLLTLWVWLVGVIVYYCQCFSLVCAPAHLWRQQQNQSSPFVVD